MNKDLAEALSALHLAKDMFIANDLILPRTFEVIDEVINKYDKKALFEYVNDMNVVDTEKNK